MMSIGTSGTVSAVSSTPTADPSGSVAGFADATGRFLPLVCTSNAAKVLEAIRHLLGGPTTHEFDRLALAADPGGPVLLPYFDGERTPYRPSATGSITGLRSDVTREQFARAAVDGVACGLLDGLDALRGHADVAGRLVLVGGGARSLAVQAGRLRAWPGCRSSSPTPTKPSPPAQRCRRRRCWSRWSTRSFRTSLGTRCRRGCRRRGRK